MHLLTLPNHVLGPVEITVALPIDRLFIDALQRRHVNNIGFVPRTAIDDHLSRHSYNLLLINDQPVGYAMQSGGVRKPLRLIQVAIDPDAWRHGLGTELINLAIQRARQSRIPGMTATVRDRLPMNQVVTATGALLTGRDTRGTARGLDRLHYTWSPIPTPPPDSAATKTKEQRC